VLFPVSPARRTLRSGAAAALHQAMTIQHRMDGAFGGDGDSGESAEEALANLAGTQLECSRFTFRMCFST